MALLDPVALENLKSMWPSGDKTTEEFMTYEFARHALIAQNTYMDNYFQRTLNVSSPYIFGEKDLRSFLRDTFAPGVKYNSGVVNAELDNFVGAETKIGYSGSGPTTLEAISLLHDDNDQLTDHPDRSLAHRNPCLDIIVVKRG